MSREIEQPPQRKSDWKTQYDCDDDKPLGPVWYFERWENLRDNLNEQPAHDRVRDRNAVNFSALKLGKKVLRFHCSISDINLVFRP